MKNRKERQKRRVKPRSAKATDLSEVGPRKRVASAMRAVADLIDPRRQWRATTQSTPIGEVMKRRYKVLPLAFPFTMKKRYWQDCLEDKEKIVPVFNRNGYYLDRQTNVAWIEINGNAWKYHSREAYTFTLETHEGNNFMCPDAYKAIRVLIKNRLADKRLRHLYYIETCKLQLRDTQRTSALGAMGMKRRFEQFKKNLEQEKAHANSATATV